MIVAKNIALRCLFVLPICLIAFSFLDVPAAIAQVDTLKREQERLQLARERDEFGDVTKGTLRVFENRSKNAGRQINIHFVILHATTDQVLEDPIVPLAGGPGLGATSMTRTYSNSWMRMQRDILLVDQRGTGNSNRLDLPLPDDPNDLQVYLDPLFDLENVKRGLEELQTRADLSQYSTLVAADDLRELCKALGYNQVNLIGGSYGTRAALVFVRSHGDSVRTAILNGVAPIPFTNPLFHAQGAQRALEKIFSLVESTPRYRDAFPDLRNNFNELFKRFDSGPIEITVRHPDSGKPVVVSVDRNAFATMVRFQMYYMDTLQTLPLLIEQAYQSNYAPFVESSIRRQRSLRHMIALGMLLSVTTAEDVARIDPATIDELTQNTFTGADRVRNQIAACELWPKSDLPFDFGNPVISDVPTLIWSGDFDPVTPPEWGDIVDKNFSNSLHLVVPVAHGVSGPCFDQIVKQFLETGSTKGLDTDCLNHWPAIQFVVPQNESKRN